MLKSLDVLFVATEVDPFVKTGSLSDLASNLPKMVKNLGHEIRVMLPGYGFINERRFHLHNLLRMKDIEIPVGNRLEQAYIKSSYLATDNKKVQVYFLSNDHFFNRDGLYGHAETKASFPDNDERFIFFCRGILETLKRLGWQPKIIHCLDWQCGLIPVYLKTLYKDDPYFKNVRTIFTAYNIAAHSTFPKNVIEKAGLSVHDSAVVSENGKLNFLDIGMFYADAATTLGARADKKLGGFQDREPKPSAGKPKKQIISLTDFSQNGNKVDNLAEKFIELYRDLAKS